MGKKKNKIKFFKKNNKVEFLEISRVGFFCAKVARVLLYLAFIVPLFIFWPYLASPFAMVKGYGFLFFASLLMFFTLMYYWSVEKYTFGKTQKIMFVILGGLLFFKIISLFFSPDWRISFWGGASRFDGVALQVFLYAYFFCFILLNDSKKKIDNFLVVLSLVSGVLAFYAVLQSLGIYFFNETLTDGQGRAPSLIGNPLFLGNYLVGSICLTIYCLWEKINNNLKYELWLSLILSIIAIFITLSSASLLSLLFGLVCFFVIFFWQRQKTVAIGTFVLATVLFLTIIFFATHQDLSNTVFHDFSIYEKSNAQRLFVAQASIGAFYQKPFWGWGNEFFFHAYNLNRPSELVLPLEARFDRAHNVFLDLLVSEGIFVFLLFVISCFYAIRHGGKKYFQTNQKMYLFATLATLVMLFNLLFVFSYITTSLLLMVCLGTIFSQNKDYVYRLNLEKTFKQKSKIFSAMLIFLLSFNFLAVKPVVASYYYLQSRLVKNTQPQKSLQLAMQNFAQEEYAVAYLRYLDDNLRQQARQNENFDAQILIEVETMTQKHAHNYEIWMMAGCVAGYFDNEKMLQYYQHALSLAPTGYEIYWQYADYYEQREENDLALYEYLKAVEINPLMPGPYLRLAQFYQRLGDNEMSLKYKQKYQEQSSVINYLK